MRLKWQRESTLSYPESLTLREREQCRESLDITDPETGGPRG